MTCAQCACKTMLLMKKYMRALLVRSWRSPLSSSAWSHASAPEVGTARLRARCHLIIACGRAPARRAEDTQRDPDDHNQ